MTITEHDHSAAAGSQPAGPAVAVSQACGRAKMRAIVQDRYGLAPADVLRQEQVDVPVIKDDEVLVRVRAAGADRGTWHLMTGMPYLMRIAGFGMRGPKMRVPGLDVAGTVEAVGRDVTDLRPGQDVFGTCTGSFAEFARARASKLAPKPASLTFEQAAAVPVSATTALQAVRDAARVRSGQRVLVIGASGGVGTFAVQLAVAMGAQVTGVCSAAKADLVSALSAEHVIDYTSEDPVDGRRRYDVILDIGGGRPVARLRQALTPHGTLVITGEDGGRCLGPIPRNLRALMLSPWVSQRLTAFIARQNHDDLVALTDLIEAGAITPAVNRVYPLAQAAAALRHLADGHARGKIVLSIGQ